MVFLITVYQYPTINKAIENWMDDWVFTPARLNRYYQAPHFDTIDQAQNKKIADMNRFKEKIVDPDSLLTAIKKIKVMLAQMTITLMEVANFIEKTKNLICWSDEHRTFYFALAALFLYCVLNLFSVRLLILLGSKILFS